MTIHFDAPTGDLIGHAQGMFGRLEVRDHDGVRSLWCDGLCQGAFRLAPPTAQGASPGPVPDAPYHLAWLLPAAQQRRGNLLMAGLGCGAGAVAVATCLPETRITIVEIDPAVETLALAHFPALADCVCSGQIEIIRQDIVELAWMRRGDRWALGLLDAFQSGPHSFYPPELLNALHGQCDELWINVLEVDDLVMDVVRACTDTLAECGWTPRTVLPIRDHDGEFTGNVIVGTAALGDHPLGDIVPFAGITHPAALRARELVTRMERLHRPWR